MISGNSRRLVVLRSCRFTTGGSGRPSSEVCEWATEIVVPRRPLGRFSAVVPSRMCAGCVHAWESHR